MEQVSIYGSHQFFWKVIGLARDTQPTGKLAKAIQQRLRDLGNFQAKFTAEAMKLFGSGWTSGTPL